ncbi:uncharacterized protein N7487_007571 [Penicillium crustosum]|uniref:uncharacterized protein n=1 Tax=Penicillium crustosum TaxID=36656 RepID=UPI002389951A|nr:uncharacterized protein N7487_007571 [Penicillium crustosum]KAJ5401675.1 hypothetical protein N7487_007571 [Penicillium crustosum]
MGTGRCPGAILIFIWGRISAVQFSLPAQSTFWDALITLTVVSEYESFFAGGLLASGKAA